MFNSVLIPVDVTIPVETGRLLGAAKVLTEPWGSTLHVVTVVPDMGMAIVGQQFDKDFTEQSRKAAAAELEAAVAAAGIAAERHVLTGTVYDRVIGLSDQLDVDLILLGANRPELRDYLLGSNAARLIRHSNKSILVLRD